MIWTAFEIAINLFQAALMVYFVRRKFHLVHPELRYAFLTAGVIAVFLSIYIFFEISITDTVVFILPACYAFAVPMKNGMLRYSGRSYCLSCLLAWFSSP